MVFNAILVQFMKHGNIPSVVLLLALDFPYVFFSRFFKLGGGVLMIYDFQSA